MANCVSVPMHEHTERMCSVYRNGLAQGPNIVLYLSLWFFILP